MELVLKKKQGKQLLEYLAFSSQKVSEEIERVEQLYNDLLKKGQSSPILKSMVERIVAEVRLPEPPLPPDAEKIPQSLEEYEKSLKTLENVLRQTLSFVERTESLLPALENAVEKTRRMAEVIKSINPSLANEAFRHLSKARRLQELLVIEPKLPLLADLESLLEALERTERTLWAEYEKTLGFIQRDLKATREITEKALAIAVLQEKSMLLKELEALDRLGKTLADLKNNPQPLNTQEFYKELGRIKDLAEEVMHKTLSPEEVRVFEALSWLRSGSESRVMDFADLIDILGKRSGLAADEVMRILYKFTKSGSVKVLTRVLP
ncbi:MAG: hypothetical protein ABWK01_01325 [Infirmifilum sp.]